MLALLESSLTALRTARADQDIVGVLKHISATLGFRSGYLIEFGNRLEETVHVIDSNTERHNWWKEFVATGMRTSGAPIRELLTHGGVQSFTAGRFKGSNDPVRSLAQKFDMLDCVLVPVTYEGVIVGLGGFSGAPQLSAQMESAVQLLIYALFAQVRSFRNGGLAVSHAALTPREKEVIALSADGLTSSEIADQLGMAARTVNQHVDNVAAKLGTKNRAHTVAEVIRHRMLD